MRVPRTIDERRNLATGYRSLPAPDREVIKLRYGVRGGRSLNVGEVAALLRLMPIHVVKIERRAMRRLAA